MKLRFEYLDKYVSIKVLKVQFESSSQEKKSIRFINEHLMKGPFGTVPFI